MFVSAVKHHTPSQTKPIRRWSLDFYFILKIISVAERVLSKMPLLFEKKLINVELYMPGQGRRGPNAEYKHILGTHDRIQT